MRLFLLSLSLVVSAVLAIMNWEFTRRHPALILVVLGVTGEVICEWEKKADFWKTLGRIFAIILVIGLAWELREAAKQDLEAEKVRKSNLELTKELRELGWSLERSIKDPQTSGARLAAFTNIDVGITFNQSDPDSNFLKSDIEQVLSAAGWKIVYSVVRDDGVGFVRIRAVSSRNSTPTESRRILDAAYALENELFVNGVPFLGGPYYMQEGLSNRIDITIPQRTYLRVEKKVRRALDAEMEQRKTNTTQVIR